MTQSSLDRIRPTPTRHPSESWDIPVGGRGARPMEIPDFAGMTGGEGAEA